MKIFSFLFVLPAAVGAANLRHGDAQQEISDTPRAAPAEHPARSFASQHRALQSRQVDTINSAVANALPSINSAMKSATPDPVPIGQNIPATPVGTATAPACSGQTMTATSTITEFQGTSTNEITTLQIVAGTENFSAGCPESSFSGDFNYVIGAPSYTIPGSTTFSATGCSDLSTDLTATITNPKYEGVIALEAKINCDGLDVTKAEVKTLTVTCDSSTITTATDLTGTDFEAALATFQSSFGTEMKSTLTTEMRTVVQTALNQVVENTVVSYGRFGGVPYLFSFAQASAEQTFTNFRATLEQQVNDLPENFANLETYGQSLAETWTARAQQTVANWGERVNPGLWGGE